MRTDRRVETLTRVAKWLSVCVATLLVVPVAPSFAADLASDAQVDAKAQKEVLEELARNLESRYAIPDTAKRLGQMVRKKQKSRAYKNITSGPQLAHALTEDLYAVAHDKHLGVRFVFGPVPQAGPGGPPPPEVLAQMQKRNGLIPKVEVLAGNVGYMRVNGVPGDPAARDAVAAAFAFLKRTDALIIDNRGNGGGDPNTVALYMSYLSEGPPYVVNTFHWREGNIVQEFRTADLGNLSYGSRKPVYVLTSGSTFSGGEELTYDIQVFKRGVAVGELTGGGANPGGPIVLGHQFIVNMPGALAVNPVTKTSWEGIGVKPDVAVPAAAALAKAHALAVERLIAESDTPAARSMLEAAAMQLESIAEAEAGGGTRLANAQIVGTYTLRAGPAIPVTILERDGRLIQHIDGSADVALVWLKGNRYAVEDFADSVTSFRVKEGKTQLLFEVPFGPPTFREKP